MKWVCDAQSFLYGISEQITQDSLSDSYDIIKKKYPTANSFHFDIKIKNKAYYKVLYIFFTRKDVNDGTKETISND